MPAYMFKKHKTKICICSICSEDVPERKTNEHS